MSPAGSDGNPDPWVSAQRSRILTQVAGAIEVLPAGRRLVGIDGIDGAGKSTFADEVAAVLTDRGRRSTVRATIDSFHNPRRVRHQRGRQSAEGFYQDSHDLWAVQTELLGAFVEGRPFHRAVFDEPTDSPVVAPDETAGPDAVLLFDGIFVHRPELVVYWDLSIYLDGRRRVDDARVDRAVRERPGSPAADFVHYLRWWARLQRYVDGQRLYHDEADPTAHAGIVIDNNDLLAPTIV